MKPFILIDPEHPGQYYALFYLLAFLIGFVLLLREGRKRNFPIIPWMMVIATAFLFFMVGCRLITFSREEWNYVLRFEPIPYSSARSVLGGILLCVPGILLAKKCLRFKADMMDAFALVLPVGLLVQRFGCLLVGCCYGTTSNLPWAIQYSNDSLAFSQHVHDGLLQADSALAMPIHPVQFYEILCCLVIVIILGKLHKAVKAPGNLFLISIGLYGVVRFLLEYLRASGSHPVGGGDALGLNYIQWAILLTIPLLFLFIGHREKKNCPAKVTILTHSHEFFRPAFYFLSVGFLFLLVSRWLSLLEIVSFNIVLLPILGALVWNLFTWATIPRYRLATLLLPLVALLLMSQTFPEYSKKDSTRMSYNTVSLGWMGGSSDLSALKYLAAGGGSSCSLVIPTTVSSKYNHSYSAQAFGIARTVQKGPNNSITFGVGGFTGTHHEVFEIITTPPQGTASKQNGDQKFSYYGIRPYVQFDHLKFGMGVGLHFGQLGNIVYPPMNTYSYGSKSSVEKYNVYPSINFRVGDLNKIFFEYKLANQFPTSFPVLNSQFALGIGLFKMNAGNIRIGTASHAGFFIAPYIPIGEHFVAEAYFGGGKGFAHSDGQVNNFVSSIGLHYKFNKREKP